MHIIKVGLPKSGNYWLHTVLKNILKEANIENEIFLREQPIYQIAQTWDMSIKGQIDINFLDITQDSLFLRISNIYRYPIDNIDDYIKNSTLVWTHSQLTPKGLEVFPQFDKIVYIIRDPRDISISWSNFVFTPYMRKYYPFLTSDETSPQEYLNNNLSRIICDWRIHVSNYLKYKEKLGIHFLFYERLLDNFEHELEKLLAYLEIELPPKSKNKIQENVTFTSMKKDNLNHLRKGSSKQWLEVLNEKQKDTVLQMATPLLRLLNYPLNNQVNTVPDVPVNIEDACLTTSGKVSLLIPAPH